MGLEMGGGGGDIAGLEQQPILQEQLTLADASRIRDICVEKVGGEQAGQWIDDQDREFRFGLANDEKHGPLLRAILGRKVLRISIADLNSDHPQTPYVSFNITQRRNKSARVGTRRIGSSKGFDEPRYDNPEDISELLGYFAPNVEKVDTVPNGEA